MRATAPRFKQSWPEEIQAEMALMMQAVAAKWIKRASRIPEVSGQARGTFRPFAATVRGRLGKAIPSTARNPRPTPGQNRGTGETAQFHSVSGKEISFEITLPNNYLERWQSRWGNPFEVAGAEIFNDFEQLLFENEVDFAPLRFLESVRIS